MTIDTNDMLNSILKSIERTEAINPDDIPNIELYMDQVTTFMDTQLKASKRYPEDKILTKTMINNYAKNNLLPPPVKKKYSKEHLLMLIFIYYFKNILSINDIQTMLSPLVEKYFQKDVDMNMEDIYKEVFGLEKMQIDSLKEDVVRRYNSSHETFSQVEAEEDRNFLQLFSFICSLSFDIYVKKQILEKLIDGIKNGTDES